MLISPRHCRILLTAGFVVFGSVTATLAEGPVVSFDPRAGGVRLIRKGDVGENVTKQFVVRAKGTREVSQVFGTVSGVLLQATARPVGSLKSRPIKLSYKLKGDHAAQLHANFGEQNATSDAPAWVWAVAAKFANHGATGAVTLIDKPPTSIEKAFERNWHAKNGVGHRLLWAKYHPAVDDTLMGFFLLTADAIVGDPQQMRSLPNGLKDFEKYSGYSMTFDQAKSRRAARTLDTLISLKARSGDHAMLNDVDESFVFTIADGRLRISGAPNYRFARKSRTGVFQEINDLTGLCRKNRHLFRDVNPLVSKTIDDFAKLVAFFNYVRENNPDEFESFVNGLKPVLARIPTMETPIALPLRAR